MEPVQRNRASYPTIQDVSPVDFETFPGPGREGERWLLRQRPPKNQVDPWRPYAWLQESERAFDGRLASVSTLFLTNRECPFRCLMCDLWKNTTDQPVPRQGIPTQIRWGLTQLSVSREQPGPHHLKLYNSGNFFDPLAIPPADYKDIIHECRDFDHLIVESHPRVLGQRLQDWRTQLPSRQTLEVALGLETSHPEILARLNKRFTVTDFERAVTWLRQLGVICRAFILLPTPFLEPAAGLAWTRQTMEWAFAIGVDCCSLVPLRGGNGVMDWAQAAGYWRPPSLTEALEIMAFGLELRAGRVLLDLWDWSVNVAQMPAGPERELAQRQVNLLQQQNLAQNGSIFTKS